MVRPSGVRLTSLVDSELKSLKKNQIEVRTLGVVLISGTDPEMKMIFHL